MKKMKKAERNLNFSKVLIVIIIALLLGIAIFGLKKGVNKKQQEISKKENFVLVSEDGIKLNTSPKIAETKQFEGLEISNAKLTYKPNIGMTELIADIINTTDKKTENMKLRVHLLNKDGTELDYMDSQINEIEAGEKSQMNFGILADFANSYDYSIEKIEQLN